VQQGLAQEVYVDIHPMHDPGLFSTYVNLTKDTKPEYVMEEVLKAYEAVKNGIITKEDLERAKTQLMAEKAFDKDGLMGLLGTINEGIACGDWKYGLSLAARVENISLDSLQQVAAKYLVLSQQVTGFHLPKE
jgi:zinc protease